MPTIDWPTALLPQGCQLVLRKSGLQFASPFNGTTQALDFVAERWVLSVNLAQKLSTAPGAVSSFCNQLAGGVNRVRAWPFGHNGATGMPIGTLRGTPTLGVAAARGDTTLQLTGCTGRNLLNGGSFEIDTNADGLADGWLAYAAGTVGSVSSVLVSGGQHGAKRQRRSATGLGAASSDRVGLARVVGVTSGNRYAMSAYVALATGAAAQGQIYFDWYASADATTGFLTSSSTAFSLTNTLTRQVLTAAAPVGALSCKSYIWAQALVTGPGLADFDVDAVQFESAASASEFDGGATLLADDYIGVGGQLFQVAADCTANDAGAMTVPLVNRVRGTIASGSAVTWHKPTAEFIMPAMQAGPVFRPGAIEGTALDLVEVW